MSQRGKSTLVFVLLVAASAAAYAVAFSLRFGGTVPEEYRRQLLGALPLVVLAKASALYVCGLHSGFNRYVTFEDLVNLGKAVVLSSVFVAFADTFASPGEAIPRGVVVLDAVVSIVALGALRMAPRAVRALQHRRRVRREGVRALIVGVNADGESLLRGLRTTGDRPCQVLGFVDVDGVRKGQRIAETPVLGGIDDLPRLMTKHRIDEVLVVGTLPGKQVRQIVERATAAGVEVRVLPTYGQLLRQDVAVSPRPVKIDDLLRRDPVDLDVQAAEAWVGGRTVLVTGSAGSIGSEVCRQLLRLKPARLVAVDRSETGQFFLEHELSGLAADGVEVEVALADLTDGARVRALCEEARPDVVFHAAAYKHVPLMERHPGEAVKNIVLATKNLADASEEAGASAFVMVSTDKAVNPTSVMGACKRIAERYVQAKADTSSCRFSTVRFGNVLGSSGSVAPIFSEQINRGGPVTVTHPDMTRYFMMIPEAAQLVIQAGVLGEGGEVFVLDMGEPVRISELARDMIRLSGLKEGDDIEVVYTGLRPGEKLYEELYGENESHRRTEHHKIMVADSRAESLLAVSHLIGSLREASNGPGHAVRRIIAESVEGARLEGAASRAAA